MKSTSAQLRRWFGLGSMVVFFIFCAVKSTYLHGLASSRVLAAGSAQVQQRVAGTGVKPKAPSQPKVARPDSMPQADAQIVALTHDLQGNIWVGTEEDGVFRFDSEAEPGSQWSHFTTNDGLGDNDAYAIACDKQGRVWVGELNHGVAVFNGEGWKNYDVLNGPIGERVFRIAICPIDGDVWMATSAGLSRYSVAQNTWQYYTRAEGLPSDQANALAFDAKGNLYVGTQCDGIAMGAAADGYKQWRVIPGPDQLSAAPLGKGLPSGLINDLLVTRDQTIYAATTAGLAFSTNSGRDWQYIRGRDYAAKVRGLAGDAASDDWQPVSKLNLNGQLLPEDYITCLAEDDDANIWMGFRMQGYAVLNPVADKILFHGVLGDGWVTDNYVTTMLPGDGFKGYVGTYGGMMMPGSSTKVDFAQYKLQSNAATTPSRFPSPAKPPTAAELTEMLAKIRNLPVESTKALSPGQTNGIYLGQDWRTEGDWTGRYGRQHAILSAMAAPLDHGVGWGYQISINASLGPHHAARDSLRYWADGRWLTTSDPRGLYSTVVGHRRITEWDDHGEAYPMNFQGPDIWVHVGVPVGVFRLAFYFVNYDGHGTRDRFRDYLLELKSYTNVPSEWEKQPTLARSRVQDFWGGEYQCFIVPGPADYNLKIGRNYSFNTMCEGVFVDRLQGSGSEQADKSWLPYMENVWYKPPDVPPVDAKGEPVGLLAARDLWTALDDAITTKQGVEMQYEYRLDAYRMALMEQAPVPLLANWRWRLPLWTVDDRAQFWETVQKAYVGRTTHVAKNRVP